MDELSSTGERVYVRLRMAADSAGRFYGDAEWVLSKCFSCRVNLVVEEVEKALCELEAAGMIVRYDAEGGRYLAITEWGVRQRSEPKFPAPSVRVATIEEAVSDDCPSTVRQLSDIPPFPLCPPHTPLFFPHTPAPIRAGPRACGGGPFGRWIGGFRGGSCGGYASASA